MLYYCLISTTIQPFHSGQKLSAQKSNLLLLVFLNSFCCQGVAIWLDIMTRTPAGAVRRSGRAREVIRAATQYTRFFKFLEKGEPGHRCSVVRPSWRLLPPPSLLSLLLAQPRPAQLTDSHVLCSNFVLNRARG